MNASVPAQILVRWNALSATVRLALAGSAVAIVAASVFVTALARAPRVPLFATPLRGEQLAEVDERVRRGRADLDRPLLAPATVMERYAPDGADRHVILKAEPAGVLQRADELVFRAIGVIDPVCPGIAVPDRLR